MSSAPRAARRATRPRGTCPLDEIANLAELGLLAMKVPAELGGGGTDNVGYVLAMQAVAEACVSTAVILASSNLVAKILAEHASPAQRERWLAPSCAGRLGPASFALSGRQGGAQDGVAELQNTQFVLADCRTELDAAWLLTLRAARLLDAGDKAAAETSEIQRLVIARELLRS